MRSLFILNLLDAKKDFLKKTFFIYSVLSESTGSFLLATLDGIRPAIVVRIMLINIKIIAPSKGKTLILDTPATLLIIKLIGMFNNIVVIIPITPATKPTIKVSALKTRDTSFLLALSPLKYQFL